MSGRSGSNPNRRHSREPADDFPPLPMPRLPSLRAVVLQRDRDSPSPTSSSRPQSRHWSAAARRAERIRNIENRAPAPAPAPVPAFDDFDRPMDDGWPTSRRTDRMRAAAENNRPTNLEDLD
ncbi:hypothetical protein FZEAL_7976, partial [Fusarium zealandicum]